MNIMRKNHGLSFDNELKNDLFDTVKSIWLDSAVENVRNDNYSVLKSSDSINVDLEHWRLELFLQEVQRYGLIIGQELEIVKANSRRSLMQQMSSHISMNFQSLYGKENDGFRSNCFQIGVRVPSKEHVSEIVGKQGMKIKEIREKTGALIITPGECEDHVFIIEATPFVALGVAKFIDERAREITTNRTRDNFQKTLPYNALSRFGCNKPFSPINTSRPILATGTIEVPKNIVGRIIGTHGSIITTIQKDTGTEIRSPPKDNHLSKAKFEILVYQKSNSIEMQEAIQRIKNAKQLIAHVAMHQMERIRAEESLFSNYRIKNFNVWEESEGEKISWSDKILLTDKEKLLNYQMQSVTWPWTDIDKLEEHVSEEVVLRILEESKKKSKLPIDHVSFDSAGMDNDQVEEIPFQQHCAYKQFITFDHPYIREYKYSGESQIMDPSRGNVLSDSPMSLCRTANDYNTFAKYPLDRACSVVRPSRLGDKNTKSYAEHLKGSSVTGAITPVLGTAISCGNHHGVIGGHIRKISPTQTAQLNKI